MKKIKKMKEKDFEMEQDLFAISKANRRGMIIFLAVMLALWCVPIYSLLKDSLKVHGLENYWYVLTNEVNGVPFYQYFINSIINAVFASALLVLICSFSGFAFSKIEFTGRKFIYNLVLMCLAISGPILIIPFFYIYKTAHLYNTHVAIILSECLITIPFGVLMMKNFFDGLPTELMESANVDGASIQRCFFSIYLPLAKPAIINLAVLQIMWSFQDFLFPLMFLTKDLTAADGYKGYDQKIETNPEACEKNCRDQIRILNSKTYDELEKEHIKDYQSVYKDVSLELDGEEYDLPTDERLRRVQNGKQDLGLSCLFFHYNRYLMIASSRKGTQPANLQGIWSESIRPVWSSNWTTNINTEMNYWLNGPCNLIESFEPFVDFVEELSHAGEETAKKQCHCSGWTANHNVDIWRQTGPVDGEPKYAYWPMGGVWLCSQSYEYFRYSEDLKTLKNKIYPSLRGSVLFCLDWMQQREDGLYYTAPSTSPENTFEDDEGHSCGVSYMTTMDLAIIKELFANYLAAADVLGIEEDLIKLVKERSKLLPGYQIGKTGMIQEWIKDFEKSDVGHRHFSPVFGFHPGHSIKKTDTELVQACQNFIEEKAENFKQQIGWSCAWLINLWARLGDGTKANHYYEELLRQSVYDNLFDLHPPLGETEGEREVFQIDGNFGSASGVAEMLISSEKGKITILPALPDSWKNGKVRGLLAAGAIEVDITWKDRKPVSVSLRSSSDQNVSLFYRNRKLAEQIELKKQEQQIINLCSC